MSLYFIIVQGELREVQERKGKELLKEIHHMCQGL